MCTMHAARVTCERVHCKTSLKVQKLAAASGWPADYRIIHHGHPGISKLEEIRGPVEALEGGVEGSVLVGQPVVLVLEGTHVDGGDKLDLVARVALLRGAGAPCGVRIQTPALIEDVAVGDRVGERALVVERSRNVGLVDAADEEVDAVEDRVGLAEEVTGVLGGLVALLDADGAVDALEELLVAAHGLGAFGEGLCELHREEDGLELGDGERGGLGGEVYERWQACGGDG